MIPETPAFSMDTTEDFETLPTRTFRLDMENGRIIGKIDAGHQEGTGYL